VVINTKTHNKGLIALTVSPFLVIDDNPIRAYKKHEIETEIYEPWV
jgi:hypothetical protein